MENQTTDLVDGLKKYIRNPANATTLRVHTYRKNDISYFPRDEEGEIEVNSFFNKNNTYKLTISREDKPTKTITIETKFLKNKQTEPDWKAILEQNRRELLVFLANA